MKYRKMGKYGIRLSEVSLGAWLTYGGTVEDGIATKCMHEALELGVRDFISKPFSVESLEKSIEKILNAD